MNQDIYVLIEHLQRQVADISYVMLAAGRVLASQTGGQIVAVLLGHQAEGLATNLAADRVLSVDHPALAEFTADAYQRVLAGVIRKDAPRAMLFGDTSIGAEVAGGLSVRLNFPLVSYCRNFEVDNGSLKFVSQVCGGKILAEGDLPAPTVLVTMIPGGFKPEEGQSEHSPEIDQLMPPVLEGLRVTLKQYIQPEPGDIDINKVPILVAVGRGLQNQDDLELAEELAEALGGAVCASRPIVDQGWLPNTRLVGKSGQRVKPKVYLALGISGAPEHVEAITGSELVIAINTDPTAPIFNVAQYGAEIDMFDLLEPLIEHIEEARGV
jgi:electron transfer flavoprotein alpha subunit